MPHRFGETFATYGFDSWVGKIPWRREQLPTPEFHGLYSPQGRQEVGTTEGLSLHFQEI